MSEDELMALSKEQLVGLVLKQAAIIERLEARVAELERRLSLNSRNSHKPPSSDGLRKTPSPTRAEQKKAGRKSGGQSGHPGKNLAMVAEAQHVEQLWPAVCGACGTRLGTTGQVAARAQVFEVPPLELVVTEFQAMAVMCPGCQACCRAYLPAGVVPGAQYGSRVKGMATYLFVQQLLPLDRASQVMDDLVGVSLGEATLIDALKLGASRLSGVLSDIKRAVTNAPVAHFDETGLRVDGRLAWLHTASTEQLTYYGVDPKRGGAAHEAIDILPHFRGVAVHDGYDSYSHHGCLHALCNAHHLRELEAVVQATGQSWAADMADLLRQAHKWKKDGKLTLRRQNLTRRRYDLLVQRGRRANPFDLRKAIMSRRSGRLKRSSTQNLLLRLAAGKDDVLRFMSDAAVPFDNNLAERDLRMMKVKQKVSGCFRTDDGARIFCELRSYISTLRKQGIDILAALISLFDGAPIMPFLGQPAE